MRTLAGRRGSRPGDLRHGRAALARRARLPRRCSSISGAARAITTSSTCSSAPSGRSSSCSSGRCAESSSSPSTTRCRTASPRAATRRRRGSPRWREQLVFVSRFSHDDFIARYGERFRARSRSSSIGAAPVRPGLAPVRVRGRRAARARSSTGAPSSRTRGSSCSPSWPDRRGSRRRGLRTRGPRRAGTPSCGRCATSWSRSASSSTIATSTRQQLLAPARAQTSSSSCRTARRRSRARSIRCCTTAGSSSAPTAATSATSCAASASRRCCCKERSADAVADVLDRLESRPRRDRRRVPGRARTPAPGSPAAAAIGRVYAAP